MTDDLLFFAKILKPVFFCRAHAQDIRRQAAQEVKDPGASKIISHRISMPKATEKKRGTKREVADPDDRPESPDSPVR